MNDLELEELVKEDRERINELYISIRKLADEMNEKLKIIKDIKAKTDESISEFRGVYHNVLDSMQKELKRIIKGYKEYADQIKEEIIMRFTND